MTDLAKTIENSKKEFSAHITALMKVNDKRAVLLAVAFVNNEKVLEILREYGTDPVGLDVVRSNQDYLINQWADACGFAATPNSALVVSELVARLRYFSSVIDAELIETFNQGGTDGTQPAG